MEFITSRPDVVRSNNQRWLCDYWSRARAGAHLPAWRGIDDDEFAAVRADLSCSDVVPANGQPRFGIRFHGERVAQLYGRENCIGKFLDEILPDAYREAALSSYRHVLASRLPVYTVADMRDPGGRIVHYERLLLPFGQNGIEVDRILASLETVSPEGAFENRGLMNAPPRPPAFALCRAIQV